MSARSSRFPSHLSVTCAADFVNQRPQETRIGQVIQCVQADTDYSSALAQYFSAGARVALVGVPESVGPQGNCGKGGAEDGWDAFLRIFMNYQATSAIPVDSLLVAGYVDCADVMEQVNGLNPETPQRLELLRRWCEDIDERVSDVVQPLFDIGFEVILIGGGHNNAYPLLRSLYKSGGEACGAVNLDPHADFRLREGRHSGNGFSYAYEEGALANYHVVSLHEGKNTAASLAQLKDAGFTYSTIHHIHLHSFEAALDEAAELAHRWPGPLGIEVDVDAIMQAPASALNYTGLSIREGYQFVARLAGLPSTRYLHLAEAAPAQHPAGTAAGMTAAGQLLSELTLAYLFGRQERVVRNTAKDSVV